MQNDTTMEIVPAEAFPALYREHIVRDFSANERRPLFSIRQLLRKGRYTCWRMVRDGEMAAYACFVHNTETSSVLLDYYAVMPHMRGTGIGSKFLASLRGVVDVDGIIIESEMPSHAQDAEDMQIRTRRIAFYERNGAELSTLGWYAFGVDYNLLWLPVRRPMNQGAMGKDIQQLYAQTSPAFILKAQTRLYEIAE